MSLRKFVTSNIAAAVSIHVALTTISIAVGIYAGKLDDDDPTMQENQVLAKNFEPLTKLVTNMYTGKGVEDIAGARLGKNCTFEDPAAICSGSREVIEAFRALRVAEPEALSQPRVIDVDPNKEFIQVKYFLSQKYMDRLQVKSLLVVDAELSGDELVIKKIEEQWNGVKPLGFFYYPSRRLNGILSFNMTKLFVK
jgi:hypothetical protein